MGTQKKNSYYWWNSDDAENHVISQYMRTDYLLQLLETHKYIIKKRKEFMDYHEGRLDLSRLFMRLSISGIHNKLGQETTGHSISFKDIADCPTSCWTKAKHESFLMWSSYAKELGVCIKSTVNDFAASLNVDFQAEPTSDNQLLCGTIDYDKGPTLSDDEILLFSKDKVYGDENEFRFYCNFHTGIETFSSGIKVPIDPNVMINEIIISPFICKEASDVLIHLFNEKYNIPTRHSKIKLKNTL